jgi:hypothetical protein
MPKNRNASRIERIPRLRRAPATTRSEPITGEAYDDASGHRVFGGWG